MNIGIYIYDNAEVLDFAGPFEVFSTAERLAAIGWNVFLVSENSEIVRARGNFCIRPHYSYENHPKIDVLIVVGGIHTAEVEKPNVIQWIAEVSKDTIKTASVCTGAFLLAEAGLLDGLTVTTHWDDITDLRSAYPGLTVKENQRFISQGKFTTSGGISAGIDMSLHLVAELSSLDLARKTARQMEYRWQE
ncbi:MAG: DJ-1/PfpI family protein [Desulfocapsaceae bacterium]|nr:DJ-1/PfpI family protein [Desulfocapsaceae bacterium]